MKHIFGILLILTLTSCTFYNPQSIYGLYRTKGGYEWGSSINLKQDSSFIYNWQVCGIYASETGRWKIKKNSLILNSDVHPQKDTTPNFRLLDKKITKSSNIEFNLYFPDSTEKLIGAIGLMFNKKDTVGKFYSDVSGCLTFPKQEYDSIKISFVGLKNIIITHSINDYFKIIAIKFPNDYGYEYFENEIWKIRGRHLIDKSKNKNYYERKFYKNN